MTTARTHPLAETRAPGWLQALGFTTGAPWWFWVGLLLNIASWISQWGRIGPWQFSFFPLWLGFILVLDGLNVMRQGSSFITRSWRHFLLLFPASSAYWWLFEWLNSFVKNWYYINEPISPLLLILRFTLNFTTVLPAVMEIFDLLTTVPALKPLIGHNEIGVRLSGRLAGWVILIGIGLLILPMYFPEYTYPLIWLSVAFILDPINNLARRPSIAGRLLGKDWKFFLTLSLAGLTCGFFWEMWNYYAMPKWKYFIPFLNGAPHYFEMPLPGMTGYFPFAFELFALYQFGLLLLGFRHDELNY